MTITAVLRQSLTLNWASWQPSSATRCTLVLVLMLLGFTLGGHVSWGVTASLGAFNAGMASLTGGYLARLRVLGQVCAVTFCCVLLGGWVGNFWLPMALTLTAGCLVFTLYGEVVPSAAIPMLQATVVLLIVGELRLPLEAVPGTGFLVLLGGAAQLLVLGVVWPFDRRQPERRAAWLAFASLAEFVKSWELGVHPEPARLFPDEVPFQGTLAALRNGEVNDPALAETLRRAAKLQAALVTLGLEPWVRDSGVPARLFRRQLWRALRSLQRGVWQRRGVGSPGLDRNHLHGLRQAALRAAPADETALSRDILVQTLNVLAGLGQPIHIQAPAPRVAVPSAPLWKLRPTPAQWQHSLRVALAVGSGELLVRLLGWPEGYWLPLTALLVLRADFLSTLTRGAVRLIGTLGAVLLSLLLSLTHPAPLAETLVALVAAWLSFALTQVGYALFTGVIGLYVILSVSASGLRVAELAEHRLLYILLGGVWALAAFLIWPRWQAETVLQQLRQASRDQQAYVDTLLMSSRPGAPPEDDALDRARTVAVEARIDAQNAVMATIVEPRWAAPATVIATAQRQLEVLAGNAAKLLVLDPAARTLSRSARRQPDHKALMAARQVVSTLIDAEKNTGTG